MVDQTVVGQRFRKSLTPPQRGTETLRGKDGGQEPSRKAHHSLSVPFKSASHTWWKGCTHPPLQTCGRGAMLTGTCEAMWSALFDQIQNQASWDPSALRRSRHRAPAAAMARAKLIISAFYLQGGNGEQHIKLAP